MAEKKKIQNKAVKKETVKNKAIHWEGMPDKFDVVGTGKGKHMKEGVVYSCYKDSAKLLVEKGYAKIK